MQSAAIPDNDTRRLETLRSLNILDSKPEERFDRLTRLAMHVFDVPIALVSLVDTDRQWFKSRQGLDATETPRDISFCGHAITGEGAFVVEDASADSRFADNPLVTSDPGVRFYAGYPIRYLDGNVLGTVCIIDHKPRQFGSRDLLILQDLATLVEHEMQAMEMATLDELTAINNRRGFFIIAGQALRMSRRKDFPLTLVFIDLNRFKPINDRFGHAEGDRVLKFFAGALLEVSRDSDIVARLGGDEFVLLLNDANDDEVKTVMARFREAVGEYNRGLELGYAVAFSYGVVRYNAARHEDLDALLAEGDALMYQRKRGGDHR
ncbi:sensor domain-containing diguanylate cyclase [Haliea sp. E1-2-M8]|uniref:sensor domain-containing diguanylate cyclase n=1 Tax=Haliea sp. E1-2-M8 TaxID=3064706 RepID=UPI0027178626|nr:sensor domain-containing diguanylate cyclase [Haliea sp. E1-2-M8]MDO8861025.1 sensor domain-containing diguanylate cyclase [Haliea sp. E1-2-M8]